jgi:hypothetical protein
MGSSVFLNTPCCIDSDGPTTPGLRSMVAGPVGKDDRVSAC